MAASLNVLHFKCLDLFQNRHFRHNKGKHCQGMKLASGKISSCSYYYCVVESFAGATSANFVVSNQFAKVLTMKISIECGATLSMGVSLFSTTVTVGIMDVVLPLAGKAVFVQQELPKLPRIHRSFNQQAPLQRSLAYSSCLHQFSLVCRFLPAHYSRCGHLPRPQTAISHNS